MENGFYWVRVITHTAGKSGKYIPGYSEWAVGEYDQARPWQIVGSEEPFSDGELEVGQKIEQPEEVMPMG